MAMPIHFRRSASAIKSKIVKYVPRIIGKFNRESTSISNKSVCLIANRPPAPLGARPRARTRGTSLQSSPYLCLLSVLTRRSSTRMSLSSESDLTPTVLSAHSPTRSRRLTYGVHSRLHSNVSRQRSRRRVAVLELPLLRSALVRLEALVDSQPHGRGLPIPRLAALLSMSARPLCSVRLYSCASPLPEIGAHRDTATPTARLRVFSTLSAPHVPVAMRTCRWQPLPSRCPDTPPSDVHRREQPRRGIGRRSTGSGRARGILGL
jgi:hypothetical protein